MSRGRLVKVLDGAIIAGPNLGKSVNAALRWAEDEGSLPYWNRAEPHLDVLPDWFAGDAQESRYWDTTKGPLLIRLRAMLPQPDGHLPDFIDHRCNDEVIIAGAGIDPSVSWNLMDRKRFANGEYDYLLQPEALPGEGKGIIYCFKDAEDQAAGNSGSFCWGPGPGTFTP